MTEGFSVAGRRRFSAIFSKSGSTCLPKTGPVTMTTVPIGACAIPASTTKLRLITRAAMRRTYWRSSSSESVSSAARSGIGSRRSRCRRGTELPGDITAPAPLVSVIIPTFHRPRLLLRAVASVLNQTLREIETIVVLDGADPETAQALDSIGDLRLRIIVLPQPVGCAGARNAGVREARGHWVAFLDDDDEWFPRKLETQIQTARQSPATFPIVACRLIARSEQGDLVWPLPTPELDEPISDYLFCQSGLRGGEGLILPSAILTARELL